MSFPHFSNDVTVVAVVLLWAMSACFHRYCRMQETLRNSENTAITNVLNKVDTSDEDHVE